MTDEPFKNWPEDFINRGIKAGVGSLPVVGGPIAEFIQFVIGDPAQERRDDFLRAVVERIVALEGKFDELKPEALKENEAFQATFIEAAQASLRTAHEKKKEMLRNAILNVAIGTVDETIRHMFMQFIERLTPLHIATLNLMNNPGANEKVKQRVQNVMAGGLREIVDVAIPELRDQRELADVIVADLENMKLTNGAGLNVTMTGNGMLAQRTTLLGRSLLQFIADPETGRVPC